MRLPRFLLLLASVLIGSCAFAAAPTDRQTAAFFSRAARIDIDAAWRLLRDNHPGAAPEMGDDAFRATLARGHALALRRAARVTTVGGYAAVLAGFDNAFRDKHIRAAPEVLVARPDWVGLIVGYRGGRWTVVDEDLAPGDAPLKGATLDGCDGRTADDVAEERLGGFRADWDNEAQRGLSAPWLLIDEHNPFLRPLARCTFTTADRIAVTREMHWRSVARDRVAARIVAASGAGAAGYGVAAKGAGWWISLQELTDAAPAVVKDVEAHRSELRAAPYVVIDLRGNGGGSSSYGDEIAHVLYDVPVMEDGGDCSEAWRVSRDNLALLDGYVTQLSKRLGPEANAENIAALEAMRAAARRHESFSRPLRCRTPDPAPRGDLRPRTFILTDRVCFSSCLLVVRRFLQLGAIQVGEPTNANTHYQENRRVPLPSGLATFSTQSAVDTSLPHRVGPYVPRHRYDGDLTDTAAVARWLVDVVLPREGIDAR